MAPYLALKEKFGAELDFRPFFLIVPLTSREFRAQRINLQDHTAVIFSSRVAIDAYFKLCEELRFKVPEDMKYFCTSEMIAMYLQKHIVFRKRKVFYGDGTPSSIIAQIGSKHSGEKFLIAVSDNSNNDALTREFDAAGLNYTLGVMVKSVTQDLTSVDLHSYDLAVLYNPNDVKSLFENFPDFKPGKLKFISYGKSIVKAMSDAGLKAEIQAPNDAAPSAAKAIELYLGK